MILEPREERKTFYKSSLLFLFLFLSSCSYASFSLSLSLSRSFSFCPFIFLSLSLSLPISLSVSLSLPISLSLSLPMSLSLPLSLSLVTPFIKNKKTWGAKGNAINMLNPTHYKYCKYYLYYEFTCQKEVEFNCRQLRSIINVFLTKIWGTVFWSSTLKRVQHSFGVVGYTPITTEHYVIEPICIPPLIVALCTVEDSWSCWCLWWRWWGVLLFACCVRVLSFRS